MSLRAKVEALFKQHFGKTPTACYQAPGRVNLMGEHTDYNGGFVLPCAINYQTVVAATPRADNQINVVALNFAGQQSRFEIAPQIPADEAAPWSNYIRGVVWVMQQRGFVLTGANLVVGGNVPQGAGLSSSASLEVAIGTALSDINKLQLDGRMLARLGQQAENEFVGINCGIMDQFVAALGQANHALLLDCRSLDYEPIPLPVNMAVLIINSNVKRGLVDSEYNARRAQCEAAATHFGLSSLRNLSRLTLKERLHELPGVIAKRARHVISENERTQAAALALKHGDLLRLGQLMTASHASMRDDFEITVPPIDTLVAIVKEAVGCQGGVRMTGGGFGGCVVALLPHALVPAVEAAVQARYPAQTGLQPTFYRCRAAAGAGLL